MKALDKLSILIMMVILIGLPLGGCSSKGGGSSAVAESGSESPYADGSEELASILSFPDDPTTETYELKAPTATPSTGTSTDTVTLVFAGDVMLARNVEAAINNKGGGDYRYPWRKVASYLSSADITFVNLESVITDKGMLNASKSAPWFRANPKAVQGLQYAGVDIVSVANNHIMDYSRTGMADSLQNLTNAGIKYTGAGLTFDEAYSPVYLTAKERKIAFLAYTNHGNTSWRAQQAYTDEYTNISYSACSGVAWLYTKRLENGIFQARADGADLIVVSLHFGTDYTTTPSSSQDRFAHLALDRGADIVIGHSPHVTQPTMLYTKLGNEKGYIAYSLGNFIFDQSESYKTGVTKGKILQVTLTGGQITAVTERATTIDESTWQPSLN